ncbi:MAG: hypothetical protein AAF597_18085, partial [Bacteroidota bacterium]
MKQSLKEKVKQIPGLGPVLGRIAGVFRPTRVFTNSAAYWEARYRKGGNSGAGSYGELARYKAEVINAFIEEHGIESVIEFGCGDGHQLGLLKMTNYLGVDVSTTAV